MTKEGIKEVEPVNTRRVDGTTLTEHYNFGRVAVEDVPEDFSQKNVSIQVGKSKIRWEYSGKCPILITETGVKAKSEAPLTEAQNQAYFALSILAEEGYVSHWEKA